MTAFHASVDELREHFEEACAWLGGGGAVRATTTVSGSETLELELHVLLAAHPQGTLGRWGFRDSIGLGLDGDRVIGYR